MDPFPYLVVNIFERGLNCDFRKKINFNILAGDDRFYLQKFFNLWNLNFTEIFKTFKLRRYSIFRTSGNLDFKLNLLVLTCSRLKWLHIIRKQTRIKASWPELPVLKRKGSKNWWVGGLGGHMTFLFIKIFANHLQLNPV